MPLLSPLVNLVNYLTLHLTSGACRTPQFPEVGAALSTSFLISWLLVSDIHKAWLLPFFLETCLCLYNNSVFSHLHHICTHLCLNYLERVPILCNKRGLIRLWENCSEQRELGRLRELLSMRWKRHECTPASWRWTSL